MALPAVLRRAIEVWRSFWRARSKGRWVARKIANRLARPQIGAAWADFAERLPREQAANEAFDRLHGTDTAGEAPLVEAGLSAEDATLGKDTYRPMWEGEFHAALAALGIEFDGFTFVDIGSGKGKLLLLAAGYPFERIVGVEFSPLLHAVAQRNIGLYRSPSRRCLDLVSMLGDARGFALPTGPLICFIFNAFEAEVTRTFMQNVEGDLAQRDQPAFVVYTNVRHVGEIGDGFDDVRRLKRLKKSAKLIVFGNDAAAALVRRFRRRAGRGSGTR